MTSVKKYSFTKRYMHTIKRKKPLQCIKKFILAALKIIYIHSTHNVAKKSPKGFLTKQFECDLKNLLSEGLTCNESVYKKDRTF